jgi:hypothetical protein
MLKWLLRNVPVKHIVSAELQMYSIRHLIFNEVVSTTLIMDTIEDILSYHHQLQPICAIFTGAICFFYVSDIKKKTAHLKLKEFLVNLDSELLLEIQGLDHSQKLCIFTLLFVLFRNVKSAT